MRYVDDKTALQLHWLQFSVLPHTSWCLTTHLMDITFTLFASRRSNPSGSRLVYHEFIILGDSLSHNSRQLLASTYPPNTFKAAEQLLRNRRYTHPKRHCGPLIFMANCIQWPVLCPQVQGTPHTFPLNILNNFFNLCAKFLSY
jgi:hypothetical protein